jgi:hypothetical protein
MTLEEAIKHAEEVAATKRIRRNKRELNHNSK